MPELPEVETIARGLNQRISGDVIESIWLGEKPEPLKSPASEITSAVEHTRILAVRRVGKHIVFDLDRKDVERAPSPAKRRTSHSPPKPPRPETTAQFIVHLGMSGRLQVCDPQSEIVKHTHAIAKLASGRELRFVDPRRFGRLSVAASGDFEPPASSRWKPVLSISSPCSAAARLPSKARYSTRSFCAASETFTPMNLCSAPKSVRAAAPPLLPAINSPGFSKRCRKFSAKPSPPEALPSQIMLIPMAKKDFSNSSTASTAAKASPAWSAKLPSNASSSAAAAATTARSARSRFSSANCQVPIAN